MSTENKTHFLIKKIEYDSSGNEIINILYPVTTTDDTIFSDNITNAKLPSGVTKLSGILNKLGNLAFQDNVSIAVATTTTNGLMTSSMVTKLNNISDGATSVTFSRSLTSGTKIGSIKINGTSTDIFAPTNTDTHYTTKLIVGASNTATANAAATNGNVWLNLLDNTTLREKHNIVGTGATTVTSDANGVITINSTNTTYTSLKNPYALTLQFNGTTNKTYDGSSAQTLNITPSAIGAATSSHTHNYLPLSGGTLTGMLTLKPKTGEGGQINLNASTENTTENGIAIDEQSGNLRIFGIPSSDGTTVTGNGTPLVINPYNKTITGGYTITGTLSGNASTATALTTSAGSATQPVYFKDGKPVVCTYTLGKSVPSNAVFTDTHFTSHLYVGASGGNTNATSATSNPYLLCVDNTTNRNSIQLKAGSNMSISAVDGVVTFTSSYTNTDTKVTAVGNHYTPSSDSSAALSASASGATAAWGIDVVKGITLNRDAKGHVTGVSVTSGKIPANPNTDTKVTQTNTTTSADYRLILSANANDTTETSTTRKSTNFLANPSTGEFYAKGYRRINITGQTLDINTLNLSSGYPDMMYYVEKTDGGSSNITNIPVSGHPFLLDVELIRWASTTDYITRQTFRNFANSSNEYVRFCNSGTWTGWTTRVFTDTKYTNFVKSGSGAKAGLVPAPSTTAGTTKYLREDGTWQTPPNTNTTYSAMTGATSSTAGTAGLVPAPAAGKQTSFLRGDGTWVIPTNTDTKVSSVLTNPTSSTTYYPTFVTGTATGTVAFNNGLKYLTFEGTTDKAGEGRLLLGNGIATGNDANKTGALALYSPNTGYGILRQASTTTTGVAHYLPATGGTILNTGTTSFTGSLTSGTKIGSIKINGTSTDIFAPTNSDLIIQLNSTTNTTYNGSSEQTLNITPSAIGAATSSHTHNYAGSSSAGGAANTLKVTLNDHTTSSETAYATYYGLHVMSTSTGGKTVYTNNGFKIGERCGTTDIDGETFISLGNNTASGTDGNRHGGLFLFTDGTGCVKLRAPKGVYSSDYDIYFPASAGTVALKSDLSNLVFEKLYAGATTTGKYISNTNNGISIFSQGGGIDVGVNSIEISTVSNGNITIGGKIINTYAYNNAVSGSSLYVSSSGQIGKLSSSIRTKTNINYEIDKNLYHNALMQLKSVEFEYKNNLGITELGMIAEDVEEISSISTLYEYRPIYDEHENYIGSEPTGRVDNYKDRAIIQMLVMEAQRKEQELNELKNKVNQLSEMVTNLLNK